MRSIAFYNRGHSIGQIQAVIATLLFSLTNMTKRDVRSTNAALLSTAQQVAFPVPGDGAVLNLSRAIPDRYRINDPASGLVTCAGCLAAPHDPTAAQMGQKFLFEHTEGLWLETNAQPSRNVRRPVESRGFK